MTEEEINKAIAEHCGKKIITLPFIPNKITVDENTVFTREARQIWYSVYPRGASVNMVPNYCGDLNLIHEAELVLKEKGLLSCYLSNIALVCGFKAQGEYEWNGLHAGLQAVVRATSKQRAEAFLKTLGK